MSDLDFILEDISSEQPCGENMEYDAARMALDVAIQGTPEDQFSGQKYEAPNWLNIKQQTLSLLNKSKDLQLILYLIRASINADGIKGFHDGVVILDKALNHYWASIHPLPDAEDGDITQRINILEELCSQELILNPLTGCALVEAQAVGRISLKDIFYSTDKLALPEETEKRDISFIKAVFADADNEVLRTLYRLIEETECALQNIENTVAENVVNAANGVNLNPVKSLFKEMRVYVEQFSGEKLNIEDGQDTGSINTDNTEAEVITKPKAKGINEITTRHEVITALDLICKYYQDYEPSSPVPILLHRAKKLVTANFMEIMQNLAPEAIAQIETIKGPESDSN